MWYFRMAVALFVLICCVFVGEGLGGLVCTTKMYMFCLQDDVCKKVEGVQIIIEIVSTCIQLYIDKSVPVKNR